MSRAEVLTLSSPWPDAEQAVRVGWLKDTGDRIEPGEPPAVVMTARGIREVRSKGAGVISKLLVSQSMTLTPSEDHRPQKD